MDSPAHMMELSATHTKHPYCAERLYELCLLLLPKYKTL